MKMLRRTVLTTLSAAALVASMGAAAQDIKPRLIRFGYGLNEQSNQGRAVKVFADDKREQVIARIRDELAHGDPGEGSPAPGAGRQIYWVCPLVDESEHVDLQNATDTHAELSAALPGTMVGLLHGRMPAAEKAAVMSLFTCGQMRVLVATTVIEVGVDVPAASLMVIEHAERFGLSQLHQLRGRVGRGQYESSCVLIYAGPLGEVARQRLKIIFENTDGFEIARQDLKIRGPGEFVGSRQSGVPLLRYADLEMDADLVELAREAAEAMLAGYPDLAERHLQRWLGSREELLKS